MSSQHDHLFKFIVIGDYGVGKTSLQTQFTEGRFDETRSTVSVDFAVRTVTLRGPITGDSVTAKLQIWDTVGQETYRVYSVAFYRSVTAVLIVFDVTQRQTFDNVATWLSYARECSTQPNPVPVTLVGNKTDLEGKREVPQEEAEDFAKAHGFRYVETSAKTAHNVDDLFMATAADVVSKIESGELDPELLPMDHPGMAVNNPRGRACVC